MSEEKKKRKDKRCLQLCAIASEFPGSFIKQIQALAKKGEEEGVEMEFVFPVQAKERLWCKEISKKYKVFFVDSSKAAININTYRQLNAILKKGQYDIVHCHYEGYDIPTKVIKRWNRLSFKLIWHLHCNPMSRLELYTPLKRIYYTIRYRYFSKENLLITNNKTDAEVIVKYAKKAKVHTITNGVNVCGLEKKEIQAYPYTFMMLGWLFHIKGVDLVIEACKRLYEKGYSFKMLVNGNEKTLQQIKEYIQGDLPPYLYFQMPQYNRNDFFDLADVLIVASRSETFNYGIAEACYLGKHIITSNIHGVDWCFGLPNVHIFENESVEALANRMEEYILNNKAWLFDKKKVENFILDNYSDENWAKEMMKVYKIEA